MADMWMPGAIKKSVGNTGAMTGGAAKATWHATSNISADGKSNAFDLESRYFASGGQGSAPHLVWDPFTGQIAQYFPADSRALALRDYGSNRTNRSGKYNIQVEVVFAKGMTRGGKKYTNISETPCKGLDKIMAWLRSLGIKDTWPGGAPAAWARDTVSWDTYHTKSGHYGHHQVPGNDHTDPGKMPNLFGTTSGGSKPTPVVPPKETGTVASTHKVVKGDTLWDLSRKYKVSVADLKKWNGLKSDTLSIGKVLKVKAPTSSSSTTTHTVVKGDTLWDLAKKYKTTVAELKKLNSLKSDTLSLGQKLKVKATSTAKPAPKPAEKPWLWFENVGNTSPNNSNKIVQDALNKVMKSKLLEDGKWGPATSGVYKKWQESLYGKGPDSDGKAGKDSLTKLGKKAGFDVRYKPASSKPSTPSGGKVTNSNYETSKAPSHNYSRTTWSGRPINKRTAEMLHNASSIYGGSITVTQGSYNRGGVAASAGTHDGGGAVDLAVGHLTGAQRKKLVDAMRKAGFAAWLRTPYQSNWPYHIHALAIGDREMSAGAKNQVRAYFQNRTGLASGARNSDGMALHWPHWVDSYR